MVQFFSLSSQIITPPSRTSIQTIRRPRHSQEAQNIDQQYLLVTAKKRYLLFLQIRPTLEISGKLLTIFFTVATLTPSQTPFHMHPLLTPLHPSSPTKLQTLLTTSTKYDSSPLDDKSDSILPPAASFNVFEPATEAEITTLIHASQNKQCDLDPIPTSLLKECADLLVPTITNIINLSLSTGTFPMQFKDLVVKPLLKKPSLDKELLSNYRPISNLSFLSKLSERVVLSRLKAYLTSNNLLNPNQSAYTTHHSTETLLTSLYNKLVMAVGHQQVSTPILLKLVQS